MTDDIERKAAVARLVAAGKMTHEHPGAYPQDDWDGELPEYDPEVVRATFPDLLEIAFDEVEGDQWYAILEDGKTGETIHAPLGNGPPPDTETLVELIQAHFRGELDTDNMDEAAQALAAFEDMED